MVLRQMPRQQLAAPAALAIPTDPGGLPHHGLKLLPLVLRQRGRSTPALVWMQAHDTV